MIRLRLSRRMLRWSAGVAAAALFLTACYALGQRVTPCGSAGVPLLLTPSIYAAERYRRAASRWIADMDQIDRRLTVVLAQEDIADPARLYALNEEIQSLTQQATGVVREATFKTAPPALVGLAEQVRLAAEAHLASVATAAQWTGAPKAEARRAALESLRVARGLRATLQASPWLADSGPCGADDAR